MSTDAGAPVLDTDALDRLRDALGDAASGELLGSALATYAGYRNAICDPRAGADVMRAAAHRLTGSAGTLGMCAIGAAASRVEAALDAGGDATDALRGLDDAMTATRLALAARAGIATRGA